MAHKPRIHFIRAPGAGVHMRIQKGGWPLDWHMTPEEAEALALRLRRAAADARNVENDESSTKEQTMTDKLSDNYDLLAKTLLDTHTGDDEVDSLLLSAAKALERLNATKDEREND